MSDAPLPANFGRFRVIEELGRGAMGIVYRAEDPMLGRVVAIKTITLTGTAEDRAHFEGRFLQEARAAGGIAHPSIITVYDFGREGDTAFMAMEFLEGRELRDFIRGGSLAPTQAVEVAALVAEALAFAHERGIVHRDVKPGNIMLLPDGRVKIMDFGIARLADPAVKTATGLLLGSPRYMAPEQVAGRPFDHRADIFSLGVVLYEALTGVSPFGGNDIPQLMFSVMNAAVTPASRLNPTLPPVLDYILARALKKEPDERYGSAAEFASDLRASLDEVAEAEQAVRARSASPSAEGEGTVPVGSPGEGTLSRLPNLRVDDEVVELRPSPRFDAVEALARLAVLPVDDDATRSRRPAAAAKPRRHLDLPYAVVVAGYVLAAGVAIFIVVR